MQTYTRRTVAPRRFMPGTDKIQMTARIVPVMALCRIAQRSDLSLRIPPQNVGLSVRGWLLICVEQPLTYQHNIIHESSYIIACLCHVTPPSHRSHTRYPKAWLAVGLSSPKTQIPSAMHTYLYARAVPTTLPSILFCEITSYRECLQDDVDLACVCVRRSRDHYLERSGSSSNHH
jgi:hypothetical protein